MVLSVWFQSFEITTCNTCGAKEAPLDMRIDIETEDYVETWTLDTTCELCGGGSVEKIDFQVC